MVNKIEVLHYDFSPKGMIHLGSFQVEQHVSPCFGLWIEDF